MDNELEKKTEEQYEEEILSTWRWKDMTFEEGEINLDDQNEGNKISSFYLGSVLDYAPSEKYYLPWCSNFTEEDSDEDTKYYSALDKVAAKFGGTIASGEGDPLDIYFEIYREADELVI